MAALEPFAKLLAGSRNWSSGSSETGTPRAASFHSALAPRGMTRFRRSRSSRSDCGTPPENGSSTSVPPRIGSRTRKCPGNDTPSSGSPMRRPISMYSTDSVMGIPLRRSITSFR